MHSTSGGGGGGRAGVGQRGAKRLRVLESLTLSHRFLGEWALSTSDETGFTCAGMVTETKLAAGWFD